MRINRFIALATGMSRRAADGEIEQGHIRINGMPARPASQVSDTDEVTLDGKRITVPGSNTTIILNKPVGYVVSREGQGNRTVYSLLPAALQQLKAVGRLDKDSSGLLVLTNDGKLAHRLTHPSFHKIKVYDIKLDHPLQPLHRQMIADLGIQLEDGPSKLGLERVEEGDDQTWRVTMHEGRNRQIRRTFAALGYTVTELHRITFGNYRLAQDLKPGAYRPI